MDNPTIVIEPGSLTASRGADKYNRNLSYRRAKAAVDYLVLKEISRDRIIAKGYGESQLTNICGDGIECTEEQHQANRRTEFKVLP